MCYLAFVTQLGRLGLVCDGIVLVCIRTPYLVSELWYIHFPCYIKILCVYYITLCMCFIYSYGNKGSSPPFMSSGVLTYLPMIFEIGYIPISRRGIWYSRLIHNLAFVWVGSDPGYFSVRRIGCLPWSPSHTSMGFWSPLYDNL